MEDKFAGGRVVRLGLHVSIAGSIHESVERANALGCTAMQIFSRNPRGWQAAKLSPDDIAEFKRLRQLYDIRPVLIHIPYIINLATPDDTLYERSIAAYIDDIARADALGVEYFVTHLGSHTGSGEESGIARFAAALKVIAAKAKPKTMILLENTAGSGSGLGSSFGQIKAIIDRSGLGDKLGVCLDTAHTFEAGYDMRSAPGLKKTLKEFDSLLGLDRIKAVHFNDSLSKYASHVDRHQHIGKGEIGREALARIINEPRLQNAAFIMETPKKDDKDDMMNIAAAKKMCKTK